MCALPPKEKHGLAFIYSQMVLLCVSLVLEVAVKYRLRL